MRSRRGASWWTSSSALFTPVGCVPWPESQRRSCRSTPRCMLSVHLFFGLPLLRLPSIVLWSITLFRQSDLATCPYHFRFRRFTVARRSSYGPVCFVMVFRTLIGWLIDWLINWLIDWLVGWLVGWLAGRPTDRPIDRSIDRLIDWLIDWLIEWVSEWVSDWVIEWLIEQ